MKNVKWLIIPLVLLFSSSSAKAMKRPPEFSTDTISFILKKAKVKFQGKKFWVVYQDSHDLFILSKQGFEIIKTKHKVIRKPASSNFWIKLLHELVAETAQTGIRWTRQKWLK